MHINLCVEGASTGWYLSSILEDKTDIRSLITPLHLTPLELEYSNAVKSETKEFKDIYERLSIYREAFELRWLVVARDVLRIVLMILCGCVTESF